MKNLKTFEALKNKAENNGRMPSLRKVAELLEEVGVDFRLDEVEDYKYGKASGCRYYTSGGERLYKGYNLFVREAGLDLDSTESYYSYNTWMYAKDLVKLVESKL